MPPKKDAAGALAERMVQTLEAQRGLGTGAYPSTLRRLAGLTDPAADEGLVQRAAAKKKPFGERVVSAGPKDLDAPIALAEDVERLADSPLLWEYLLTRACSPDKPTCEPTKLKAKLPAKLKKPFGDAVERRLKSGDLPAGVAAVADGRKKKRLHLLRYPLPQPPEVVLAENLVKVLQAQKRLGGGAYPLMLSRLVDLTQPGADAGLVEKAVAHPAFQERALLAFPRSPRKKKEQGRDTPVALAEDGATVAGSPLLLEVAVRAARSNGKQLFSVTDLKKGVVGELKTPFGEAAGRHAEARSLPPAVGCLYQKKGAPVFFLLTDVRTGVRPAAPPAVRPPAADVAKPPTPAAATTAPAASPSPQAPVAPAPDFAAQFDEAFQRLERQRRHNAVSLVDLRREVRVDRPTFDAGLWELRRAGRYTLSAAEGRDGNSPEEQQAGILEEGSLLLFVSRKSP